MTRFAVALCLLLAPAVLRADEDLVVADFEGPGYGEWKATGDAFGAGPAAGTLPRQQAVAGFVGKGLVNSYLGGDGARGTLTSPPFEIRRDYVTFLIGGGANPGTACIDLIVDGRAARTATGNNDERLAPFTWDVRDLKGKTAELRITDNETGGWGHVNVDQVVQTDRPQEPPLKAQPLYQETLRPQFHFTAAGNWLNDPNGLVFYGGEYHLFFQHNPRGLKWGNMTWGHAVSTDLVRWKQLPDALEPDALGTMFSGSAVVDWNNTAGFQRGDEKTLAALYTAAGNTSEESKGQPFTQCLAYSNDRGRTWTKFAGNPVIPAPLDGPAAKDARDPKVVWHEPTKRWVMALYKVANTFALFDSPDLKTWTKLQEIEIPGCIECPDFFPMTVAGEPGTTRWVLTVANGKYLVGSFDGKRFAPEQDVRQVDHGRNFFAVQSHSDVPTPDGRRIQIAWMREGQYPRMPFNQQMSFPLELTLRRTPDGLRIFNQPVREIASLRGKRHAWSDLALKPGDDPLANVSGELFEIIAEFESGDAQAFGFRVRGEEVRYDVAAKQLTALGTAPLELQDGRLKLRVLVDRTSIETFGNDGRVSLTSCFLPKADDKRIAAFAKGGTARVVSLEVYELKSAWPTVAESSK